jgi:DNA-binding CsgD family transcriptional regulator
MIANSVLEQRASSATGAAALGGSNSSGRAAKTQADRPLAVAARRPTVSQTGEKRLHKSSDVMISRAAETSVHRSDLTKSSTVGCQLIDLGPADNHMAASDYTNHQVIFVLLVPKGASDPLLQDLMIQPSRLTSRGEGRALIEGAALQVDLPSAVRLSAVREEILAGIARASSVPVSKREVQRPAEAPIALPNLTRRERQVLQMILEGHPNKNIAADLQISMRTVENHRAKVMKKTGSKSLPALVRLAIAAGAMPEASPR